MSNVFLVLYVSDVIFDLLKRLVLLNFVLSWMKLERIYHDGVYMYYVNNIRNGII